MNRQRLEKTAYFSPSKIRIRKSRRMRRAGKAERGERGGRREMNVGYWWENQKEREH
jgi:hypothetical protein